MNALSKKRNYLLILVCFLVYMSTYFLKYSFNANIVNIEDKFNVLHSETGLVTTLFFFSYGVGQFVNGAFVKKYNLKIVVPVAIIASCFLNILVMLTKVESFFLIKFYWLANGAILSFLWPCTIRMITENISEEYENKAIICIGLVTAVGTTLTYLISAILTKLNVFNLIFAVGALLGVIFCVVWLLFYDKVSITPEEKRCVNKEVIHKDKENFSFFIYVAITGLLAAVSNFVRDGLSNWSPTILVELFNFDNSLSVLITIFMPLAQFVGSIGAVRLKKHIKSHMFLEVLMVICSALVLSIGLISNFTEKYSLISSMAVTIFCMTVISCITTSMIPMVWSKFRNSGKYAGIFNGCCYMGAAAATYGLGAIADNGSWSKVFIVLIIVLATVALISGAYLIIAKIFRLGFDESGDTRVRK